MYRYKLLRTFTLFLLLVTFSMNAIANSVKEEEHGGKDLKTEIKEYINHHLLDSYDFSLFSWTTDEGEHKYFGAPLPVILWDGGLKVFLSSKFHHGETVAEVGG
ncbi:MAG: ATP synthase F0 subunit A, partial [Lutibacter sp.]|nr:ATP synthase F0 subunit A [Lutibacter sp.]